MEHSSVPKEHFNERGHAWGLSSHSGCGEVDIWEHAARYGQDGGHTLVLEGRELPFGKARSCQVPKGNGDAAKQE